MELPFPPGFIPHQGSTPFSWTDGVGILYYSAVGPGGNYGITVFRLVNGQPEVVPLERDYNARGSIGVDADGYLYVTACYEGTPTRVYRERVAGWTPRTPTGGPVPPPPPPPASTIDAEARRLAQQALDTANHVAQQLATETRAIRSAIQELRNRPVVTEARVAEIAWAKAGIRTVLVVVDAALHNIELRMPDRIAPTVRSV